MDDLTETRHRLVLQVLKAHMALREIERVALTHEIDSPATDPERKIEAIARRDAAIVEWGDFMTEHEELCTHS